MEKEEPMKYLLIALLGFVLVGCSTPVKQIEVSTKPIERPNLVVPKIDPIKQKNVEWIVITEENAEEVFERLRKMKVDVALLGVTDKGYESLSLNFAETQRIIRQYKAVIAAYEAYYLDAESALDNAEKNKAEIDKQIDAENQKAKDESEKPLLEKLNPFN